MRGRRRGFSLMEVTMVVFVFSVFVSGATLVYSETDKADAALRDRIGIKAAAEAVGWYGVERRGDYSFLKTGDNAFDDAFVDEADRAEVLLLASAEARFANYYNNPLRIYRSYGSDNTVIAYFAGDIEVNFGGTRFNVSGQGALVHFTVIYSEAYDRL